jgi:hypothetical protein
MIDFGAVLSVMGNHELNALTYHTADPHKPGEHLRPRNGETLRQIPAGELASYLDWFRTLPLWLDFDGLRVVHACWDDTHMAKISRPLADEYLHAACSPNGSLFEPVEASKEVRGATNARRHT